jgi:YVTN family beta-propeller protein
MKLWPLLTIFILLLLASPAFASDTYMGYVTSRTMDTVMVFDPNTNAITTSISTGSQPRSVYLNPAGTYLYTVTLTGQSLEVYDTSDNKKVYTIALPEKGYMVTANKLGTKLYVGSIFTSIYVIDPATKTISKTITLADSSTVRGMTYADGKIYAACSGTNKVAVIDTTTDTLTGYITVGAGPGYLSANPTGTIVYVVNSGANTVSVIDTASGTVTATINVGNTPVGLTVNSQGSRVYVVNQVGGSVSVIDTSSNTVTATITVANSPQHAALEPNGQRLYVSNYGSNNMSIIDTSSNTVTGSINCSYNAPDYMFVGKVAATVESSQMEVTFTITSGGIGRVTDANVSVYDATTGEFMDSDDTDDAGNVIFTLIVGKRYTVTVTGEGVISSSQSVQVQPNKDQYTINVQTTGWSWNPFDWFNTNGTTEQGSPDQRKSITSGYKATTSDTTGYLEVYYNDTTGQTSKIDFQLYYRNTTAGVYDLIDTGTVNSNNGTYNFTILNSGNKSYRFYANGTSTVFGNVSRMGSHTFYNYKPVNLGWPSTFYMYFDILVFLLIAYMSTKRESVMLAGATFELFVSWIFLIFGWMNGFGIIVPIMITVFAIILFVYAIARWRIRSGY